MKGDQLLAMYDRVSGAEDAIPRLRRFVLDLAVRGKLVAQDAADEPASDLLKRIEVARQATPVQGRKSTKRRASDDLAKLPFELPCHWATCGLGGLVRVINGRAYKKQELLDEGTPVLRVGNLFTSKHWYYSDLELDDDKYCDEGDLIYAWSASFGPFIWDGPRVIYHYHIWKLELFSEADLDKDFLYLFLLQKTREIKDAGHGISMIHMTKEKMEQLAVPLPPLAEQHRIVAKVAELMGLLDQLEQTRARAEGVRARLTTATWARLTADAGDAPQSARHTDFALKTLPALITTPTQIKTLRQTILNLAVRGKLVAQDPNDEPAKLRKFVDATISEGKLDAKIPPNWRWVRVEDVADARLGKMLDKAKNKGSPYPYLRNTNVHWFDIRLDDLKTILLDDAEFEEYRLKTGDVLICEGGHGIGRTAVWRDGPEGIVFQKALHRVRPAKYLIPDFFAYCCHLYFEEGIMQTYFTGVGIPHFTGRALAKLVFPLPPLAEQHRIVAKVDALMALCDQLETALTTTATTRQRLLETLIRRALSTNEDILEAAE